MADDIKKAVDALGEWVQARRKDLSKKVEKTLPAFIHSIEHTATVITFDPGILPYKQVDPQKLLSILEERYNLRFKPPNGVIKTLQQLGKDTSNLESTTLLQLVLLQDDPFLVFENGRFPTGTTTFIPINKLIFSSEKIIAEVSGLTEVGEVLISEVFEILWEATGISKRWDSRDVQARIYLRSYGTATKVNLGANPWYLLGTETRDYLQSAIVERKLGSEMFSRSIYDKFNPPDALISSMTFDEFHFIVHLFDPRTGRSEDLKVRISVTSRDEAGRGIVDIITKLPFDKHMSFVEGLINAIGKKKE